jgi:hypothetical protein
MDKPSDEWWSDIVYCNSETTLSLWERIRLLFVGRFAFHVEVKCEHLPGRTEGSGEYVRLRHSWARVHTYGGYGEIDDATD